MIDALGWGVMVWLIGYVLGIVFFMFVPPSMIGLYVTPIGLAITLWILLKKINGDTVAYYLKIGTAWLLIAVIFDYLFIVQLLHPVDGYYKLDIYFYYLMTFLLPLLVGWYRLKK